MSLTFQVTFDCHDLAVMTRFWSVALGYREEPPPEGHASWTAYAQEHAIPPEQWRSALSDPEGRGHRLFFQPVPEGKTAKNRVHLDIDVRRTGATPQEGRELVEDHARRCEGAGATVLERFNGPQEWHVVMADPEGNEFCVQ